MMTMTMMVGVDEEWINNGPNKMMIRISANKKQKRTRKVNPSFEFTLWITFIYNLFVYPLHKSASVHIFHFLIWSRAHNLLPIQLKQPVPLERQLKLLSRKLLSSRLTLQCILFTAKTKLIRAHGWRTTFANAKTHDKLFVFLTIIG